MDSVKEEGVKKQKHVPREMERLSEAVERLFLVVNDLESKLSSILTDPEPPVKTNEEATVASHVVVLAADLREIKWRIDGISRIVDDVHKRLEL